MRALERGPAYYALAGAAIAVAHVDALGVHHQKEVHHGALAPVVGSKVGGQHALVVLADSSARKGEEQHPHRPLRGAEDDGSVEGKEAPAELAYCCCYLH